LQEARFLGCCKISAIAQIRSNVLLLLLSALWDNRRRQKLADLLEGYGRRVQKSAFECFLSLSEMQKLYQKVQRRVKATEDDVCFDWVPADAVPRSLTIGSKTPEPPPTVYIIRRSITVDFCGEIV
jgi:CRISPR-associated protein Cas2